MNNSNSKHPFIVAIDGPAGSGKTTTAKALAGMLGFLYIDTGAMYRAVAFAVKREGIPFDNPSAICDFIANLDIRLQVLDGTQRTLLNNEDVELEIRSQEISHLASIVSAIPCVRKAMVEIQRHVANSSHGSILEGRDIGTVVFPESQCKIFLVADVHTRAERRRLQLTEKGLEANLESIEREIIVRDQKDAMREHSPLLQAPDAIIVDTTDTTIEEQVSMIYDLVKERLKQFEEKSVG